MTQPSRVRLEEVVSTVSLTPAQCAAVVMTVAARLERWRAARHPRELVVPALCDISLTRGGSSWWSRGLAVHPSHTATALGPLLRELLAGAASPTPAGLLYIVARATVPGHEVRFEDTAEFVAALARYAPERPGLAVDALLSQYFMATSGVPPLDERSTISDVRRRRRAGGVSLATISRDTGVPLSLLRELEWGVYANWDITYSTPTLVAYAERAGLDPAAVLSVVASDQAETRLVPAVSVQISRPSPGAARDVAVPFVLAALVMAMIAATVPRDREPASASMRMPAVKIAVEDVDANEVPPMPEDPPTLRPAAAVTPGAGAPAGDGSQPRAPQSATTRPPSPVRQQRATSGARSGDGRLVRLARAIAGDGRHKVEPFPRPR